MSNPRLILEKLRRRSKSDLIDLVKMHLSFLIDVTTEEWAKIIYYVEHDGDHHDERQTKSTGRFFTSVTSSSSTPASDSASKTYKLNLKFAPPKEKELASNIFGNPLSVTSLLQAMIMVDFLFEDENYKLEGIFRKSGTQSRQQDLRFMLNNGAKVDLKANRFTAVDVSCVLKEFIQKLPEPLLTTNHYELYYELAATIKREKSSSDIDAKNEKRLKITQLLIHLLPEVNRKFFFSLMKLLNRVARAIDVTKMDERSLAVIFGQHVLCPRNLTPKQLQKDIEIITDAMEFLLLHYREIFSGPKELVLDAQKRLVKVIKRDASPDEFDVESENETVVTFCDRQVSQEPKTDQALAELYAQVQAMPETPQKRKLIKQFNKQNGFGTPMSVTSHTSSTSTTSRWGKFLPPMLRPKHL